MYNLRTCWILVVLSISVTFQRNCRCASLNALHDVIVVGAGMAGLQTSARLVEGGLDVICLEASGTVGGRMRSVQFGGKTVELGANWVHGIHKQFRERPENPIWKMATDLNLAGHLTSVDNITVYLPDGRKLDSLEYAKAMSDLEAAWGDVSGFIADRPWEVDIRSALREAGFPNTANGTRLNISSGAEWMFYDYDIAKRPSFASARGEYIADSTEEDYLVTGGFQRIPEHMAASIENHRISLNTEVAEIHWVPGNVTVVSSDGRSFSAKQIVITVSIEVLRSGKIRFEPPLPSNQRELLKRFNGTAYYSKLFLRFETPFWPTETDYILFLSNSTREKIASFLSVGDMLVLEVTEAVALRLESEPMDVSVERAMNYLRSAFGTIPDPVETLKTNWSQDPHVKMSFTAWPVGFSDQDFREMCSSVDNQIYFAGEACSGRSIGYLHGAYFSGNRIADEILKNLSKQKTTALLSWVFICCSIVVIVITLIWALYAFFTSLCKEVNDNRRRNIEMHRLLNQERIDEP
eukprot:343323_1